MYTHSNIHIFSIMSASNRTTTTSNEDSEQMYDNFLQMSLGELQDYLSLRKLSISGEKKGVSCQSLCSV